MSTKTNNPTISVGHVQEKKKKQNKKMPGISLSKTRSFVTTHSTIQASINV
jgi:hypothetical protein